MQLLGFSNFYHYNQNVSSAGVNYSCYQIHGIEISFLIGSEFIKNLCVRENAATLVDINILAYVSK